MSRSIVPSVDPSETTITSNRGYCSARNERTEATIVRSSSWAGTRIDTGR